MISLCLLLRSSWFSDQQRKIMATYTTNSAKSSAQVGTHDGKYVIPHRKGSNRSNSSSNSNSRSQPYSSSHKNWQLNRQSANPQRKQHNNDGMTKEKAKRICGCCYVECKNENNDMLHPVGINPPYQLDPSFVNFLIVNQSSQSFRSIPIYQGPVQDTQTPTTTSTETPTHTPVTCDTSSDTSYSKQETKSLYKLPCRYCPLGLCKTWRSDTKFSHLHGWFTPLTRKQIEDLKNAYSAKTHQTMHNETEDLKEKRDEYMQQVTELAACKEELERLKAALTAKDVIPHDFDNEEPSNVDTKVDVETKPSVSLEEILSLGKSKKISSDVDTV